MKIENENENGDGEEKREKSGGKRTSDRDIHHIPEQEDAHPHCRAMGRWLIDEH